MSDSDRDIPVMIASACSLDFSPMTENFFLTAWQEVSWPEGKRDLVLECQLSDCQLPKYQLQKCHLLNFKVAYVSGSSKIQTLMIFIESRGN